jgi:phosphate transport system substrate-binding protein
MPENLRAYVPDPSGAQSYPIATFTWILLRRKYESAGKAQALRDLFTWTLGAGQQYASALGYIPLPTEVGGRALAALQAIKP